jgi:hypothetical protein
MNTSKDGFSQVQDNLYQKRTGRYRIIEVKIEDQLPYYSIEAETNYRKYCFFVKYKEWTEWKKIKVYIYSLPEAREFIENRKNPKSIVTTKIIETY